MLENGQLSIVTSSPSPRAKAKAKTVTKTRGSDDGLQRHVEKTTVGRSHCITISSLPVRIAGLSCEVAKVENSWSASRKSGGNTLLLSFVAIVATKARKVAVRLDRSSLDACFKTQLLMPLKRKDRGKDLAVAFVTDFAQSFHERMSTPFYDKD
jgi:hypothetical protein